MAHLSGVWWLVLGAVALVSLVPVLWAVVDVLRRPTWQFSPGRKALWTITLGVGWLIGLWPLVLVSSVLYLTVLRRRLPSPATPAPGPVPGEPVPEELLRPVPLPPAAWYPDPSGVRGERWWDGLGWSHHTRAYPS